jgi:outer membrane lipoprotein SlyB
MNDMSQTASSPARNQTLWAAIGVLGVAVVALGSALYYVQTRQEALHTAAVSPVPVPVVVPALGASQPAPAVEPSPAEPKAAAPEKKTGATKPVASRSAKPAASSGSSATASADTATGKSTTMLPAKEVCLNCATITAVTPVEREGTGSGAGAVAGGVLGALVGNQFGGGDGKTLATIAGAVGGGMAGNAVEKKMKKVTAYRVELRMDDGSFHSIEQAAPASVGARVRVDGNTLQPLN